MKENAHEIKDAPRRWNFWTRFRIFDARNAAVDAVSIAFITLLFNCQIFCRMKHDLTFFLCMKMWYFFSTWWILHEPSQLTGHPLNHVIYFPDRGLIIFHDVITKSCTHSRTPYKQGKRRVCSGESCCNGKNQASVNIYNSKFESSPHSVWIEWIKIQQNRFFHTSERL